MISACLPPLESPAEHPSSEISTYRVLLNLYYKNVWYENSVLYVIRCNFSNYKWKIKI